jgi:hypothetical protein
MKSQIKLKTCRVEKLNMQCSDIDGILRTKYIHPNKFIDSADKSIGFCDVVLAGI